MNRILKWRLPMAGICDIEFNGSVFIPLSVQVQDLEPMIWAEVDAGTGYTKVSIEAVVTGGSPPVGGKYIGTVQIHHGTYVLHYYLLP